MKAIDSGASKSNDNLSAIDARLSSVMKHDRVAEIFPLIRPPKFEYVDDSTTLTPAQIKSIVDTIIPAAKKAIAERDPKMLEVCLGPQISLLRKHHNDKSRIAAQKWSATYKEFVALRQAERSIRIFEFIHMLDEMLANYAARAISREKLKLPQLKARYAQLTGRAGAATTPAAGAKSKSSGDVKANERTPLAKADFGAAAQVVSEEAKALQKDIAEKEFHISNYEAVLQLYSSLRGGQEWRHDWDQYVGDLTRYHNLEPDARRKVRYPLKPYNGNQSYWKPEVLEQFVKAYQTGYQLAWLRKLTDDQLQTNKVYLFIDATTQKLCYAVRDPNTAVVVKAIIEPEELGTHASAIRAAAVKADTMQPSSLTPDQKAAINAILATKGYTPIYARMYGLFDDLMTLVDEHNRPCNYFNPEAQDALSDHQIAALLAWVKHHQELPKDVETTLVDTMNSALMAKVKPSAAAAKAEATATAVAGGRDDKDSDTPAGRAAGSRDFKQAGATAGGGAAASDAKAAGGDWLITISAAVTPYTANEPLTTSYALAVVASQYRQTVAKSRVVYNGIVGDLQNRFTGYSRVSRIHFAYRAHLDQVVTNCKVALITAETQHKKTHHDLTNSYRTYQAFAEPVMRQKGGHTADAIQGFITTVLESNIGALPLHIDEKMAVELGTADVKSAVAYGQQPNTQIQLVKALNELLKDVFDQRNTAMQDFLADANDQTKAELAKCEAMQALLCDRGVTIPKLVAEVKPSTLLRAFQALTGLTPYQEKWRQLCIKYCLKAQDQLEPHTGTGPIWWDKFTVVIWKKTHDVEEVNLTLKFLSDDILVFFERRSPDDAELSNKLNAKYQEMTTKPDGKRKAAPSLFDGLERENAQIVKGTLLLCAPAAPANVLLLASSEHEMTVAETSGSGSGGYTKLSGGASAGEYYPAALALTMSPPPVKKGGGKVDAESASAAAEGTTYNPFALN